MYSTSNLLYSFSDSFFLIIVFTPSRLHLKVVNSQCDMSYACTKSFSFHMSFLLHSTGFTVIFNQQDKHRAIASVPCFILTFDLIRFLLQCLSVVLSLQWCSIKCPQQWIIFLLYVWHFGSFHHFYGLFIFFSLVC